MIDLEKLSKRDAIYFYTSILGIGVIGFGLGIVLSRYFLSYAFLIIIVGLLMHSWGMYKTHPSSRNKKQKITLMRILYWTCWIILLGLAVYTLIGILR